jgi:hypothetical protein
MAGDDLSTWKRLSATFTRAGARGKCRRFQINCRDDPKRASPLTSDVLGDTAVQVLTKSFAFIKYDTERRWG